MKLTLQPASTIHATAIAALRQSTNEKLTRDFGPGPWTPTVTENGVLFAIRNSRVYIVRDGRAIIGTLTLATKKPWAIDRKYFTKCQRPLYLINMAVAPDRQRHGIGRAMLADAIRIATAWPSDAICLDAYDLPGGAGEFYAKCGYRETGRVTYRRAPLIYYELVL